MHSLALAVSLASAGAATAAPPPETFKVDPVHSAVAFRVKHMNVSYALGRFNNVSGGFTLDADDPSKAAFDVTIRADSIDTANGPRDAHLKGPDFFNVRQYPTIRFQSTSAASAGEGAYEVQGNLSLHGVTKPITVKIQQVGVAPGMRGGRVAGVFSEFTIKRSDFGMKGMIGPLGDEVTVIVSLEGGHN